MLSLLLPTFPLPLPVEEREGGEGEGEAARRAPQHRR